MSVDFSRSPLYNAIRTASRRRATPSLHARMLIMAISAHGPESTSPRATKSRQHIERVQQMDANRDTRVARVRNRIG